MGQTIVCFGQSLIGSELFATDLTITSERGHSIVCPTKLELEQTFQKELSIFSDTTFSVTVYVLSAQKT